MIEAALLTVLPVAFLIIIFWGGALFLRKKIEQDGEAPINRTLFFASKYSIIVLWGAIALASWGIGLSPVQVPRLLQLIGLAFWFAGFALLYLGRFKMGDSFRLGTPKEDTSLKTDGLFSLSRNPMYVGVYATIVASSLYTLTRSLYCWERSLLPSTIQSSLRKRTICKRYSAANIRSIATAYGGTSDVPGQNDGGFRICKKFSDVRIGKK